MNPTDKSLGLALRLYYVAVFVALGVYLPFFPRWLEARNIQGFEMGLISATAPAMGLIGPPVFGWLADAFGLRGFLLRCATLGACLCFTVIGFVAARQADLPFVLLFPAVLLASTFRSVLNPLADVITIEYTRVTGTSYARIRLWGSLGFLVTAVAAGRWMNPESPATLPFCVALGLLLAVVLSWTLPVRASGSAGPSRTGLQQLLGAADFRLFLATTFLSQLAHSSYDLCYSLHLRDLGADGDFTGWAWALGVICEIGLMMKAEPLLRRYPPRYLIAFALLGAAIRWMLLGRIQGLWALLTLQPLHALSFGLMWISCLAWIRDRAPLQSLATAQGLFSASTAAGNVLGMLIWSELYRRFGGEFVYSIAASVALTALGVALVWSRRQRVDQ